MADDPENWLNPHPMHQYMSVPTPPPQRPMYLNCPIPNIHEQYQTVMTTRRQLQPPPRPYPPALQPRPPPPPTVISLPQENLRPRWNVPPIRRQMLPAMQPPPRPYPPALQPRPPPPTVVLPPQENILPRLNVPNNETTVLIRNIPFSYNRKWMIQFLDNFCIQENRNGENIHVSAYDYLYLPFDTKNNRIRGYAFVNFTDKRCLRKFILSFGDGVKVFPGSKRHVDLAIAYIQGKNALVDFYRYAPEAISFYPPRNGYGEI